MKMVVFVRHAYAETNAKHMLSSDIAPFLLKKKGIAQAKAIAGQVAKIHKIDALYTSPVFRAMQTAEIIGKRIGVRPHPDVRITERHMGELNNRVFLSPKDMHTNFKKEIISGYEHGLESWKSLSWRMRAFADSAKDGITVAVTHSDPIMAMLWSIDKKYDDLDFETKIPYATATVLDLERRKIICIGSNLIPKSLLSSTR